MKKEQGHKIHFFPENLLRSGLIKSGKGHGSSKSKLKPSPALVFYFVQVLHELKFSMLVWLQCSSITSLSTTRACSQRGERTSAATAASTMTATTTTSFVDQSLEHFFRFLFSLGLKSFDQRGC